MSESMKDGLIKREVISQKKPQKTDEKTQRPAKQGGKADSAGKPGSFKWK